MDQKSILNYNRKQFKYPSRYDIEQTLGKFAKREFVEEFAKSRGIFVSKATREQLADKLSYFFYDDDDIEIIREVAYKTSRTQTLSGFSVKLEEGEGLVESIRTALTNNEFDKHVNVGPITKVPDSNHEEEYQCNVEYISQKPGRIEFLQEESRSFTLVIRKTTEEDEYQVLTVGNKATDDGICQKIIKKSIKRRGNIISLDIDELTTSKTITFFDRLSNDGIQDEWNLLEVRQLAIRKGEEEIEEVEHSDLTGINQAVLDGDNLRQNTLVKQTEKNNYRFLSMTYRFQHKSEPCVIDIKAEFKLRPKVYVIDVQQYFLIEGADSQLVPSDMPVELKYDVKDKCWNSSRRIFREVRSM